MRTPLPLVVVCVALICAACSGAARSTSGVGQPATTPQPAARPIGQYPHTPADVEFMSGMIAHHAQAVMIAKWAPSHGASAALQRLCERIVVGQSDEIALMQTWLRDRGEKVPAADAHLGHDGMLMPGMLTQEQVAQLDRSRGVEFDRLFLNYMIQHHEGAIVMVDKLFASPGAGQDEVVFRFASDVYADQTTEIEHMKNMLAALPPSGDRP